MPRIDVLATVVSDLADSRTSRPFKAFAVADYRSGELELQRGGYTGTRGRKVSIRGRARAVSAL